jgi:hypothetical protein
MWSSKLMSLSITFFALNAGFQNAERPAPTQKQVALEAQTATSTNYLATLFRSAGLWGGIESYKSSCAADTEMRLPALSTNVGEALANLQQHDNSLTWKVDGDGILVTKNASANSVLDSRVGDFTFNKNSPPEEPTARLLSLPIIRARMAEFKLTERPPEIGFAQAPVALKPDDQISLRDPTFRQALSSIASVKHNRVWLFQQTTCAGRNTLLIQWLVK